MDCCNSSLKDCLTKSVSRTLNRCASTVSGMYNVHHKKQNSTDSNTLSDDTTYFFMN